MERSIIDYRVVNDISSESKHQKSNIKIRLRNCGGNMDKFEGNSNVNKDYVCESNNNNNSNDINWYYFTYSDHNNDNDKNKQNAYVVEVSVVHVNLQYQRSKARAPTDIKKKKKNKQRFHQHDILLYDKKILQRLRFTFVNNIR